MNEKTIQMLNASHPDACMALLGGGLLCTDPELEKHIGRIIRFIWRPGMGSIKRRSKFRIVGVQRIYDGRKAFRVHCLDHNDTFGCPALPDEVRFVRPRATAH